MIGDSLRDIGAAHNAGIPGYGVRTGYGCRDREAVVGSIAHAARPDLMFDHVAEATFFALHYQEIAGPVVEAIEPLVTSVSERPVVISVSGRSRVGKSVLAHALARVFSAAGRSTLVVPLDYWSKPLSDRKQTETVEERNQVKLYQGVLSCLKNFGTLITPGYDAGIREAAVGSTLDASNKQFIIADGVLAGHPNVHDLVDCAIHVIADEELQHARFISFYRWKGLDNESIAALWQMRRQYEWPVVDAQKATSDVVVTEPSVVPAISDKTGVYRNRIREFGEA